MNITYDLRYASDHFPGVGTYAYWLLRSLLGEGGEDRLHVLWDPGAANTRFDLGPVRADPRVCWHERPGSPLDPTAAWRLGRWLRRLRPDVYFSPFYLRPLASACPCVLVLHDVQPLRMGVVGGTLGRVRYRMVLWNAVRAEALITDSEFSRAEIADVTGLPAGRVRVVSPGVPPAAAIPRRPSGLPDGPFALTVGIDKPHKNLVTLFRAWAKLGSAAPLQLVHAGPPASGTASGSDSPAGGRVLRLGRVGEAELAWLYSHATLLAFPSLYEGFGFPLLEAMAAGVPALAADIPALRELGQEAVRYVSPEDPVAWADAARELAGDASERQRLSRAGRERAAGLTFARTAAGVRATLREVVDEGRS